VQKLKKKNSGAKRFIRL